MKTFSPFTSSTQVLRSNCEISNKILKQAVHFFYISRLHLNLGTSDWQSLYSDVLFFYVLILSFYSKIICFSFLSFMNLTLVLLTKGIYYRHLCNNKITYTKIHKNDKGRAYRIYRIIMNTAIMWGKELARDLSPNNVLFSFYVKSGDQAGLH